jgi:hypothetical protein
MTPPTTPPTVAPEALLTTPSLPLVVVVERSSLVSITSLVGGELNQNKGKVLRFARKHMHCSIKKMPLKYRSCFYIQ